VGLPHRSCFVGSEFVDYLMRTFTLPSRADAVAAAEDIRSKGIFQHVTSSVSREAFSRCS
jgi:hypothetical protein